MKPGEVVAIIVMLTVVLGVTLLFVLDSVRNDILEDAKARDDELTLRLAVLDEKLDAIQVELNAPEWWEAKK